MGNGFGRAAIVSKAALAVCLLAATPAWAQGGIRIPAQRASSAINQLARQTGIQILFDHSKLKKVTTHAVDGARSPREALTVMLDGTGYEVGETPSGALTVKPGPGTASRPLGNAASGALGGNRMASLGEDAGAQGDSSSGDIALSDSDETGIVVTGSRIRGAIPASPVRTVDRKEIEQSGFATTGDLIRSVPQTFGGNANVGVVGGAIIGGNLSLASTADLRGLGPDATLTLLNGHRLAFNGTANVIDISMIPLTAIKRVEILTDGASAIYGSDAVAGVVNFILREDFSGLETSARMGTSTKGGAREFQASQLAGTTWSGGNAMLNVEYQDDQRLLASQRSFTRATAAPFDLLPNQNRLSLLGTVNQDFGHEVSVFGEALYSRRRVATQQAGVAITVGGNIGYVSDVKVQSEQFATTGGLRANLGSWSAELAGTYSQNLEDYDQVLSGGFSATADYVSRNRLYGVEVSGSGPLIDLPAGPLSIAVGGGYRREGLDDRSAELRVDRDVWFTYGEVRAPIVRSAAIKAELSGSARFEKYSDFGTVFTPKLGAVIQHSSGLRLRGTLGRAFRAPALEQIYGQRSVYVYPAQTLAIPNPPPGATVLFVTGANASLRPEKSTSWTLGADYRPRAIAGLAFGATYFSIDYKDRISAPNISSIGIYDNPRYQFFIVKQPDLDLIRATVEGATVFGNLTGSPYADGNVYAIYRRNYLNAVSQSVRGVDVSAAYAFESAGNRFGLRADATWLDIDQIDAPASPERQVTGYIYQPRSWKARVAANFERKRFSATIAWNYLDGGTDDSSQTKPGSSAINTPISAWSTLDLNLSYEFEGRGLAGGFKMSLSAQNLLDRNPPEISPNSNGASFTGLGFESSNASPLGRFVSIGITKSW